MSRTLSDCQPHQGNMKLLTYLFMLKCCLSLSRASSLILQPNVNKKLELIGSRTELSCNLKGKSLAELELFWLRMAEDGSPQFVISASVLNKIVRGTSIDDRFTVIRNHFQSSFSLVISNLELSDSGTYHCLLPEKHFWGRAIQLTVVTEIQKVTSPPPTTIRRRYYPSKPKIPKKTKELSCGWMVWGSLLMVIVLLLISITTVIIYRHRNRRRRCPHHFRKRYA